MSKRERDRERDDKSNCLLTNNKLKQYHNINRSQYSHELAVGTYFIST